MSVTVRMAIVFIVIAMIGMSFGSGRVVPGLPLFGSQVVLIRVIRRFFHLSKPAMFLTTLLVKLELFVIIDWFRRVLIICGLGMATVSSAVSEWLAVSMFIKITLEFVMMTTIGKLQIKRGKRHVRSPMMGMLLLMVVMMHVLPLVRVVRLLWPRQLARRVIDITLV